MRKKAGKIEDHFLPDPRFNDPIGHTFCEHDDVGCKKSVAFYKCFTML